MFENLKVSCNLKMEERLPNQKKVLNIVKFSLLAVTLFFALFFVAYFLFVENFRTSIFFFYLVICCVIFLYTTYNVMKGKLLEKYSVNRMRLLWKYSMVKIAISLGIVIISIVVGLSSNEDTNMAFRKYYVNIIPGSLGLFWSTVFFFDFRSYINQLTVAQGNAEVFHNGLDQVI